MLHKTDSLIAADFILRILRSDLRLKYIDGFIAPFVNKHEHGYTINFIKANPQYSISFALNEEDKIVVYINSSALFLVGEIFENIRIFESDQFKTAKEYIINSIILLIKIYKINSIPST
jgi:hypothetical protein